MMIERARFIGSVETRLHDADGSLAWSGRSPNMIVNGGLAEIANLLIGTTTSLPVYIALGTGTTAVSVSQTALGSGDPTTWRSIAAKTKYSTYIASYETIYTTTQANGTWSEIGLFSNATATAFTGVLFARALISVTKTSSQTLSVSWRVQVS